MLVIPSIDLEGGRAVKRIRGIRGQYLFVGDPLELARRFSAAPLVHIVDLDGAEAGRPMHVELARRLRAELKSCQLGGGLRSLEAIEAALSACDYAVVGTLPFVDRALFLDAAEKFGDRLVVSLDVKGNYVMGAGWRVPLMELDAAARLLAELRPAGAVYTAIDVEGTGMGVVLPKHVGLLREAARRLYYAGGVANCGHLRTLMEAGFDGAVVGYALYRADLSCVGPDFRARF